MTRALDALAGRRLLLLNWRDLEHPRAGGAEVYTEQVAARLAAAGAEVDLLVSHHPGAALVEQRGRLRLLRTGSTYGVYAAAAKHMLQHRGDYDAVVDFQNGIPFFAPLFVDRRTAVVCVVHHVHQEQFALHYPWPASRVGQLLEGPASRVVYGDRPVVAVSPSTRHGVRRRLRLRGPIHVVPNGLDLPAPVPRSRSEHPSIGVISRLVSHKRMDLLVEAVSTLRASGWPDLTLDVAGDGPDRSRLEALVRERGLQGAVRFHGFVEPSSKTALLARSWLTASPSQAEGWGLTVLEAAAAGVPAVAFPVPGLRDSILDRVTGWLVPDGRGLPDTIADALTELRDPRAADQVADRCRSWAARFSWDSSAERLASVVVGEIARRSRGITSLRHPSDLAVVVELTPADVLRVRDRLPDVLRTTDVWSVSDSGARLLLQSCDEAEAVLVLERLGVHSPRSMSLATGADLLTGAA